MVNAFTEMVINRHDDRAFALKKKKLYIGLTQAEQCLFVGWPFV